MEEIDRFFEDLRIICDPTASCEAANEAHTRISAIQSSEIGKLLNFLIQIMMAEEVEPNIIVQGLILLKNTFRPTHSAPKIIIRNLFNQHFSEFLEPLCTIFLYYSFSEDVHMRTIAANSFAQFMSTLNYPLYNEIILKSQEKDEITGEDGLMLIAYESSILDLYPGPAPDLASAFLLHVLNTSKKHIIAASMDINYDYQIFMTALHTFEVVIKLLHKEIKANNCGDIIEFLNLLNQILPNANIDIYQVVFDILATICETFYINSESFFGIVYDIAMKGMLVEGDFLEVTLNFWTNVAISERKIIKKNFKTYYNADSEWKPRNMKNSKGLDLYGENSPPYLIKRSISNDGNPEEMLLPAILECVIPPDDCPEISDPNSEIFSINRTAISCLSECILSEPSFINSFILPKLGTWFESEKWQEAYAAMSVLSSLCSKYSFQPLFDILPEIIEYVMSFWEVELPILNRMASSALSDIFNMYPSLITREIIEKIISNMGSEYIMTNNELYDEILSVFRIVVNRRIQSIEFNIAFEAIQNIIIPNRNTSNLQFVDRQLGLIIRNANSDAVISVFNELIKLPEGADAIDFETFIALESCIERIFNLEQKQNQYHGDDYRRMMVEIIIEQASGEIDVGDMPVILRALYKLLKNSDQYVKKPLAYTYEDYLDQIIDLAQRCFQSGNPPVLKEASLVLGYLAIAKSPLVDCPRFYEGLDAILANLERSEDEVRSIFEVEMVTAVGLILKGQQRFGVPSELYERTISEMTSFLHSSPPSSDSLNKETREHFSNLNAAIIRAMADIVVAAGPDGIDDGLVKEVKHILIRFLRTHVIETECNDKNTFEAMTSFFSVVSDYIPRIRYLVKNRHVLNLVRLAMESDDGDLACEADNFAKMNNLDVDFRSDKIT